MSGTFFVEQAHAIALLRPDWIVALCQFDLARSRMPWRPRDVPQFVKDWLSIPQLEYLESHSGLHEYRVWLPFIPRFGRQSKWDVNVKALASQAKLALEDFIQRFGKPDLIHAQSVYPGGAAAVALGKEYDIAVGLTEHLGPFPPPTLCLASGQVIPLVASAYAGASLCSAVSQSLADRVQRLGLADEVTVLPNFLPDQFGSVVEQQRPVGSEFSFLSVGGPSHAKGTDVLLKALAKVSSDVTLKVVGDSPMMAFFRQLAADLGVSARVKWLGAVPRDQMPAHYQTCDAFVLPSQEETFGIAFIEALAFGKPLIATRCGGPEEIVNTGNGLLVPLNDVDGLVAAMKDMVENEELYNPGALRADFIDRFSASAALPGIEAWYRAVIRTDEPKVAS
ncbi:glycosyltransferase [Laribacter hongkongensis]|uniref:glycosyltransferase n=1 Tax=Laribacter hongkongensis TaxID=168471 RepID=UPI00167FD779|nr:glycosyltransferase [Laribacter hongkongensis]